MRHARTAAGVLGVLLAVAGCSSSTSKPSAMPAGNTPTNVATLATAAAPATHPGLGASQTLKFTGGTATMAVLKIVDPAKPTEGREDPGMRDVAAQIRITDNGPATFTSGPMATLQGYDADGQTLQKHVDWPTSAGPELDALTGVTVAVGDTAQGFVTFIVPAGAKLARLQYTPPAGSMVEWTLS